jgi:hypothetical protein
LFTTRVCYRQGVVPKKGQKTGEGAGNQDA